MKFKVDGARFLLFLVGLSFPFISGSIGMISYGASSNHSGLLGGGIFLLIALLVLDVMMVGVIICHKDVKKTFRLIFCYEGPQMEYTTATIHPLHYDYKGKKLKEEVSDNTQLFSDVTNLINCSWKDDQTGVGRDAVGLSHQFIKIKSITEITNKNLEENYALHKAILQSNKGNISGLSNVNQHAVITSTSKIQGHDCDKSINEVFLFHGTLSQHVDSIVQHGFNKSTGGMFGQGVYLAESAQKSDQYTDARNNRQTTDLSMIVVKALLGRVAISGQAPPILKNGCYCPVPFMTYCKDPSDTIVHNEIGTTYRFREFLMKKTEYVIPKFIVVYDRI